MIIDIETGKQFKRVRKAERIDYMHPEFYEMTGMHAPKKEYDMGQEHLRALLEDVLVDHEKTARKIMHIQSMMD